MGPAVEAPPPARRSPATTARRHVASPSSYGQAVTAARVASSRAKAARLAS